MSAASAVVKRLTEKGAFEDRLIAEVADTLKANPYRPKFAKPNGRVRQSDAHAHEMMVVVSDAHYPEVVDPSAAFGLAYTADIARRRLEYMRDTVIRYKKLRESAYPVQKLTIAVIGDMLSGSIHEELEVTNEMPMSAALVNMSYMLHDMGSTLAQEFPAVEMVVMPGNHPRITKKPRFKGKWDNWEYVMGLFVKALAQRQYTVTVPKDMVYRHKIFDLNIGLTHGDGVKAASAFGMPWYSMRRRQDALQSLLKTRELQQLDLLCYGHFHQLCFMEGQGCSLFVNGSIKGGDEFSIGTGYSSQEPVQGLLTFHPKHGITDLSRINLGHIV